MNEEEKMKHKESIVFNLSPKEYDEINATPTKSYDHVGIHFRETRGSLEGSPNIPEGFIKQIPDEAVAVVNYRIIAATERNYCHIFYSGIALIPNEKKEGPSKKL